MKVLVKLFSIMGFQLDKVILDTKTSLFLLFKSRDVIIKEFLRKLPFKHSNYPIFHPYLLGLNSIFATILTSLLIIASGNFGPRL